MPEAAKWYVVHTYSGYENKVAKNIEKVVENRKIHELIQEVRVPTEKVIEITETRDKKTGETKSVEREVERKTFPGYVLIKMVVTDDTWYIVRNTRGCTGFVGPASAPTPLTEEEIKRTFGIDVSSKVEINFNVGDRVQISGTAMDGSVGIVQSINLDDRTVDLLVSMFGRETPTTLPISQVVSVD
ncbi:MAG: transcription termination/antitermination protein NusG [Ruminococcus sp.]|nr:transcription termination/antitermination protein NusG [Ruminococcus sp.]MDE7225818.1 transcription termination/antitermination protein NusG [Ruminococcus sp.]